MRKGLVPAFIAALALAACGQPAQAPAGGETTQSAGAAPGSCDAPAVPVAIGATANGSVPAAQSYPDNARYFCFSVPQGASTVTVTLSGMTADLDLFIGANSISSVQGQQLQQGQTYDWMSNNVGTADDTVTMNAPAAGVYYAEIVSYQGEASNFTLAVH